jgi:hypothetical protein
MFSKAITRSKSLGAYTCSLIIFLFFNFINFCETLFSASKTFLGKELNSRLNGYVLYYGLYSKSENYYATLYDYTSFWCRLNLVIKNSLIRNYLEDRKDIFHYNDVMNNFDELSHHFVDAALLVYVESNEFKYKLSSHSSVTTNEKPYNYVYAVAEDDTNKTVDITKEFNTFQLGVSRSNLTCKDLVKIMVKYKKENLNFDDITLKLMNDNDFDELLFKGSNSIYT